MRTELAHLRAASHLVQRDYRRAESALRAKCPAAKFATSALSVNIAVPV